MLEYWNDGYWDIGVLGKWHNLLNHKTKNGKYPSKTRHSVISLFYDGGLISDPKNTNTQNRNTETINTRSRY